MMKQNSNDAEISLWNKKFETSTGGSISSAIHKSALDLQN